MSDADSEPDQGKKSSRKPSLVSRLIGMETEYATLIMNQPDKSRDELPVAKDVFAAICAEIRKEQPTATGVFDSEQMFLASGGAVSFESHPSLQTLPGGLVELATPEVNSPMELLACQRSIDELVADAADNIDMDVDLRILKNSSDALGHVYGCQENYETSVARGPWLLVYWFMILVLWIMQAISMTVSFPILMLVILIIRSRNRGLEKSELQARQPAELFETMPGFAKVFVLTMLRIIHFPIVMVLRLVVTRVAFRRQQRYLTAHLASRVALCGTGDLDHDGCFRLSAKAMAIDTISHMGSYRGERPVFVYGHWLAQFCAKSFMSLKSTRRMFRIRQRFQVGLSDSNLCDLPEYVKVGSVSLILDMIEAGKTKGIPILKRPIEAIHDIAGDWNLVTRVDTNLGLYSSLEIQKLYLKAAKKFVESVPSERRGEASEVIARWQELLDAVIAFRKDAFDTAPALGRVDWLTKRWMLDQLDENEEWAARKKTDLRYHELSEDGYHRKLAKTNPELNLVTREQIEQRRKYPPPDSPAARRGWTIREFSGTDESIQSEWTYALLNEGRKTKRLPYDKK